MSKGFQNLLIVPAAGRSSRYDRPFPKGIDPIRNPPILSEIIESITSKTKITRTIVIVNSTDLEHFKQWSRSHPNIELVIDDSFGGSGRAIETALENISDVSAEADVIICWSDHIGIRALPKQYFEAQINNREALVPIAQTSKGYTTITLSHGLIKHIERTNSSAPVASNYADGGIMRMKKSSIESVIEASKSDKQNREIDESNFIFNLINDTPAVTVIPFIVNRREILENVNSFDELEKISSSVPPPDIEVLVGDEDLP